MRFDLDEPLYPPHHALPGLLTGLEIDDLEHEWKAAKIDEWCSVAALDRAAVALRSAVAAPVNAPIAAVLAVAEREAGSRNPRVRDAVTAYRTAATRFEGVRAQLDDIRRRAFAAPASRGHC